MELTEAFKQTDVGLLPSDWDVIPLGELVTRVEYGSSAKSRPKGRVPVLRMGNLQHGKIDWGDLVYTDDEEEIERYTLHDGEVLFNRTNTIELVGKTAIYEGTRKAIFAGYLIRVVTQADRLDARYLNYVMNTEVARKHSAKVLSVAVGQANINGQKLRTYPIPVPPTIGAQQAIAAALGDVDQLLERLDQLIAKKHDLRRGAMQKLLGGNVRLPGFDCTWEAKTIGDLARILSGGTPRTNEPTNWDGGILWCTPTDVTGTSGKYLESTKRTISGRGLETSGAQLLPAGTLLLCSRATIGEVKIARKAMCTNQGFKSLACKPEVSNEFLYYKLLTMKPQMLERAFGSTFLEISARNVAALALSVPPLEEQLAIAAILSEIDAEIDALSNRRRKTAGLRVAMMQGLLTGQTRLITTGGANG